jgi:hypothetical protein
MGVMAYEARFMFGLPSDGSAPKTSFNTVAPTKLELVVEELIRDLGIDTLLGHLVSR